MKMVKQGRKSHLINRGGMVFLLTISLLTSHHVYAFQKGDWVFVTERGNGLYVYDNELKKTIATRKSWQGGGILDGPHPKDSRFWKIRWDDRVEGWSAEKSRDGSEIWLDLFARYRIMNISAPKEVNAGSTWTVSVTVYNEGKGNTGNLFRMGVGVTISGVPAQDIAAPVKNKSSNTFTVSFNIPSNAQEGTYHCIIGFYREIDGQPGFSDTGDYWLTGDLISFYVKNPGKLEVSPSDGLTSFGPQGGPFSPSSKQYTLKNTGGQGINWSALANQTWITVSPSSGSINPGGSTTVTVSINSNANSLSPGTYKGIVSFRNTTNGLGDTTRTVDLTVQQPIISKTLTVRSHPVSGIKIGGIDPNGNTWIQQTNFSRVYNQGDKVTLVASLSHNREDIQPITPLLLFDRWEGVDQTTEDLIAYVTMNSDRTVTAHYGQVTDLSGNIGQLTVEVPDFVNPGQQITFVIRGIYTGTKSKICKIRWVLDISTNTTPIDENVTLNPGEFFFSKTVAARNAVGQFENTIYLWLDLNNNGDINANERLAQKSKLVSISTKTVPVMIRTEFEGQTKVKIDGSEYTIPIQGLKLNWVPGQEYEIEFPDQEVTVGQSGTRGIGEIIKKAVNIILNLVDIVKSVIPSKNIIIKPGGKENQFKACATGEGCITIKPSKFVYLNVSVRPENSGKVTVKIDGEQKSVVVEEKFRVPLGSKVTLTASDSYSSEGRLLQAFERWDISSPLGDVPYINEKEINLTIDSPKSVIAYFKSIHQEEGNIRVEFQVLDGKTGEPIGNVILRLKDNQDNLYQFNTNEKGFSGGPLKEGNYLFYIFPPRYYKRSNGDVVTYLTPAGGSYGGTDIEISVTQNQVILKPRYGSNWGGEWLRLVVGSNEAKYNVTYGEVIITMWLLPIILEEQPEGFSYETLIQNLINKCMEKKIPPHIAVGTLMVETGGNLYEEYDGNKWTIVNKSKIDSNHTDSGFGIGQLTGLTALEMAYERGKLEKGTATQEDVINQFQKLATLDVNLELMLDKLSKNFTLTDRASLGSWKIAVENYNPGEEGRSDKVWGKLISDKVDNRMFLQTLQNKLNPFPIPKRDDSHEYGAWDPKLKDSDFDGKLDGWDKYPQDPTKLAKVSRQEYPVEEEPNDTPEQANTLNWNEILDGVISPGGDVDWFKFSGERGQWFVVRVTPYIDDATGEVALDPIVTLYDENLTPLTSNDDDLFGEGLGAAIREYRLPKTGTYYLKVEDLVGRGGDNYGYFIELKRQLEDDHGDSITTAQPITVGQTISGHLGHEGDLDVFRFEIEAGSCLWASLKPTNGDPSLELVVLDERGNWLDEGYFVWDNKSKAGGWVINGALLPTAGTYYLMVKCDPPDQGGEWLTYTLDVRVAKLPQPIISADAVTKELQQGERSQITFTISNQGEMPFKFQMAQFATSEEATSKMRNTRMVPIFLPEESLEKIPQISTNSGLHTRLRSIQGFEDSLASIFGGRRVIVLPSREPNRIQPSRQAPSGAWQLLFTKSNSVSLEGPTSFSKIWVQQDSQNLYFRFDFVGHTFDMDKNLLVAFLSEKGKDRVEKVILLGLGIAGIWAWDEFKGQFQQAGILIWQSIKENQVEVGAPWDVLRLIGDISAAFLILDCQGDSPEFSFVPDQGWIEINREVSWLQVEAAAGEIEGGETLTVTLSLNAEDIEPGTYQASLVVFSKGEFVKDIPVLLKVRPPEFPFENTVGLFMVSLPISVDKQWHEILGISEDQMKLAIYESTEGRYRLYSELTEEERKPKPGVGVWIKLDNPVQTTFTGILPKSREPFVINLKPGWQIIGVPWQVKWTNLKVRKDGNELTFQQAAEQSVVHEILWTWDPEIGDYQMVWGGVSGIGLLETLDVFKGYWVFAFEECQLVIPPKSDAMRGVSSGRRRIAENGFVFGLVASDGQTKRRVWLGFTNEATGRGRNERGLQAMLPPESPGQNGLQVFAINTAGKPLAADVRFGNVRKMEWDVIVKWDAQQRSPTLWGETRGQSKFEEIRMTWDGLGYLPKGMSAWLIDTVTGARRYLRTQSVYSFRPEDHETQRHFKVILEQGGVGLLRIMNLRATPTRGREVLIQFALTKPATTHMEVLTLTGRKVALVETERNRSEGQNTVVWRGVDSQGRTLPNGVYLIRVYAQDEEGRQVQAVTTFMLR